VEEGRGSKERLMLKKRKVREGGNSWGRRERFGEKGKVGAARRSYGRR